MYEIKQLLESMKEDNERVDVVSHYYVDISIQFCIRDSLIYELEYRSVDSLYNEIEEQREDIINYVLVNYKHYNYSTFKYNVCKMYLKEFYEYYYNDILMYAVLDYMLCYLKITTISTEQLEHIKQLLESNVYNTLQEIINDLKL